MSVTWFDRGGALAELQRAVRELARRRPEVRRVILFGSLARADAVPGSDADLLVVLESADRPFLERLPLYQPQVRGLAVDVFAYTQEELDRMLKEGNWLVRAALAEGIELDLGTR